MFVSHVVFLRFILDVVHKNTKNMANRVTVNGIMRIFFSMVIKLSLQKEWYFPGISNIIRNARKIGVYFSSYSCFRLGFIGNQPFNTRSRCSKISFIVQNDEKEKTPSSEEMSMSLIKIEPMIPAIPKIRKIHQQRVPQ